MIRTTCKVSFLAAICTVAGNTYAAKAGEITLTSPDKTVIIRGEFAGFQQDTYIVRYNGYNLRVPAAHMICDGDDCFIFKTQSPSIQENNKG